MVKPLIICYWVHAMKKEEKGVILDTTVFNLLAKNNISRKELNMAIKNAIPPNEHFKIYASNVQYEELKKTPVELFELRASLLKEFSTFPLVKIAPPAIWDLPGSNWDEAEWCDAEDIKVGDLAGQELMELDQKNARKRTLKKNNEEQYYQNFYADVAIFLTAFKNNLILVTGDKNLAEVAEKHVVKVIKYHKGIFYFSEKLLDTIKPPVSGKMSPLR